jgi:AmmeMemoRadiSam system protein B
MNLRKSSLPRGWYPQNPDEIKLFLSEADVSISETEGSGCAAIAPHAGWFYSGKIAARAVKTLKKNIDTVVVIGGHLPKGCSPLFAMEDAVNTPLGNIEIDRELRAGLCKEIGGQADKYNDNTVEVLLPMVRFFMPKALLLWLRLPAELSSYETGITLAAVAGKLGRNIAVLASADLTHYGPNFGFTPKGCGPQALRWVMEVNDRYFINAVESGDPSILLEKSEADRSCCSSGAVLAAMGYASALSAGPARLIEYSTSAGGIYADGTNTLTNAEIPDSFVGYAAFVF